MFLQYFTVQSNLTNESVQTGDYFIYGA